MIGAPRQILILATLCLAGCCTTEPANVPDTQDQNRDGQWQETMAHGDVEGTHADFDPNAGEHGALRVDYAFPTQRVNHIGYAKQVQQDLSGVSGLAFRCKALGDSIRVYLILDDSSGKRNVYWAIPDTSKLADWTDVKVDFQNTRMEEQGNPDFSDIRTVTLFLLGTEPARGAVWFSEIRPFLGESTLHVFPDTISPNGDGVYDSVSITGFLRPDSKLNVDLLDAKGKVVRTLGKNIVQSKGSDDVFVWHGHDEGKALPEGHYQLQLALHGAETSTRIVPIEIISIPPWPPIHYSNKPFFPVGIFMHLSPEKSGIPQEPSQAEAFIRKHFKRIASAGFNTVYVAHQKAEHEKLILTTAQQYGLRVILDAMPLVQMQYTPPYKIDEREALRRAKGLYAKYSQYPSFLRYALFDEPGMDRMPSWLVLQRITASVDSDHPVFSTLTWPQTVRFLRNRTTTTEICVDIYPFQKAFSRNSNECIQTYQQKLQNFLVLAKGRPLWVVLPAFSNPGHRYPTPEEICCVTYLSLARGAQGIIYFTYFGWPDHADKVHALVNSQSEPTELFVEVSRLAGEVSSLAPLLLDSTRDESLQANGDAVVGAFTRPEGTKILIAVNPSMTQNTQAVVHVPRDTPWRERMTGRTVKSTDGVLTLDLPPGQAVVLLGQVNPDTER